MKTEMKVLFVKFSDERNRKYAIKTTIAVSGHQKLVIKEALFPEGQDHIKQIDGNQLLLGNTFSGVDCAKGRTEDDYFAAEYVEGELLSERFAVLVQKNDRRGILALFDAQLALITSIENITPFQSCKEFEQWFGVPSPKIIGSPAYKTSFFDATAANIIYRENHQRPCFIDYEWCFCFPVPIFLVKFHLIDILYQLVLNLDAIITKESFLSHYLDEDEINWAANLQEEFYTRVHQQDGVFGQDVFSKYAKPVQDMREKKRQLEQGIEKQSEHISHQDQRIVELERNIGDLNVSVAERDTIISTQNSLIEEKDGLITERNGVIQELGNLIEAKDAKRKQLSADLKAQRGLAARRLKENQSLKKKNTYLSKRDRRLKRILKSRSWRYARKIARVVRWVFPRNAPQTKLVGAIFRLMSLPARRKKARLLFEAYAPLQFPLCPEPIVSIIIPVHNQFPYTYRCLESILKTCGDIPYEVIVSDDDSGDDTRKIDGKVKGIHIIRNKPALRFLKNCNGAAKMAKGKYLVFLNNDTIVHENWLQSMLSLLDSDSQTGMVGSQMQYPNGKLQEAGGIIWEDGSGWNYGRFQDPEKPEFNYVKEADYISGCSLMIRKSLWDEIGGFDERFAPAYYEDSDLAFEVRRHGYKVMYQPASKITHFEGISHGTDVTNGMKAYQVVNHTTFLEKWGSHLAAEQFPNADHIFRARDRSKGKKMILFADNNVPTFDKDAGSRTMYEYIKLFCEMDYHVVLLPDNMHRLEPYTGIFQQMGVEVLYGRWYKENIFDWLLEHRDAFDAFFLARPHVTVKYIDFLKENTNAPILFYGMDLHFLREQREYELKKDTALLPSIEKHKALELELIQKADVAFYPSVEEEKYLTEICPEANVVTLPVFILEKLGRADYHISGRKDAMFVGGFFHHPNIDAVIWFVKEILPHILKRIPGFVFHVVGSNAPEEILGLASDHVIVHGFVETDQLIEMYGTIRLSVVPLRYGAGIKGKVVEAMSFGVPVVTTPIGAEGFVDAGEYLAVEENAGDFAECVCNLYQEEDTLSKMVAHAYDYLAETFSAEKATEVVTTAMEAKKASDRDTALKGGRHE